MAFEPNDTPTEEMPRLDPKFDPTETAEFLPLDPAIFEDEEESEEPQDWTGFPRMDNLVTEAVRLLSNQATPDPNSFSFLPPQVRARVWERIASILETQEMEPVDIFDGLADFQLDPDKAREARSDFHQEVLESLITTQTWIYPFCN